MGFPGTAYPTINSVITLSNKTNKKEENLVSHVLHKEEKRSRTKPQTYFKPTCIFVIAWIIPTGIIYNTAILRAKKNAQTGNYHTIQMHTVSARGSIDG